MRIQNFTTNLLVSTIHQDRENILLVEKLAIIPVTIPRITDAQGGIKPDAGVAI
jgi:hypothetical protein